MIEVRGGCFDIPVVETTGFKMIDVGRSFLKIIKRKCSTLEIAVLIADTSIIV